MILSLNSTQPAVGIFTTDTDLVIRVWDATLARLTGIAEESATGQSLASLLPDLEQRGLLKRFQHTLSEGVVEVLATAFHHYLIPCAPTFPSKYFEKMQQSVSIAPLLDGNSIAGLMVTVEDVTERLERERELTTRLTQGDEATRLDAAEAISVDNAFDATPLLGALSDESWRVRRVAVEGVSQRAAPEAIAALLSSVVQNHHNASLLNSALQVLTASDVDTLSPLLELLSGPNADLRMQAALALGEQRDERAVAALVNALNDDNTNVRYHVIEALGKLAAVAAIDKLAEIAASKDFFLSYAALDALTKIGHGGVVPRVVALLEDELLREPALNLLGQLGDESVVPSLTALLNTPNAPTDAIADTLATLSDRYQEQFGEGSYIADLARNEIAPVGIQNLLDALETPGKENLRSIALVLGWLRRPGVDQALTRLMGRDDLRNEIIDALVQHGSTTLALLIEQLKAEDLEVRRSAVVALGRIGDARATGPLLDVLQEKSLALETSNALAQIGDARAVDGLLGLIGNDDASIRQAAVNALNSLAPSSLSKRMIPLLHDPDPNVRESAVKIVGYFGYPGSADELLDRCNDENERVRSAAIEHLPYIEDPRTLAALIRAIKEGTPAARAAAARAFGNVDSAEAVKYLIEALADEDVWVRYFSARALGRCHSTDCITALERVLRDEEFNHVRIAALDSLGQIGGPHSAGVVAGLIDDNDREVAQAARVALEQMEEPKGSF